MFRFVATIGALAVVGVVSADSGTTQAPETAKIKSDGATVYINDDEVVVASRLKRAEECANDDRGAIYNQIQGAFKELALKPAANEAGGLISSAFFPGCSPAVAGAASRCPSHHAEEVHFYARGLIPTSVGTGAYTCVLTVDKVKHVVAGTVLVDGADRQKLSCTLPKAIHATDATFDGHVDVYENGYHKLPMIDDMNNPIVEFYDDAPVIEDMDLGKRTITATKSFSGKVTKPFQITDHRDGPDKLKVTFISSNESIANSSSFKYDAASQALEFQFESAWLTALRAGGIFSDMFTFEVKASDSQGASRTKIVEWTIESGMGLDEANPAQSCLQMYEEYNDPLQFDDGHFWITGTTDGKGSAFKVWCTFRGDFPGATLVLRRPKSTKGMTLQTKARYADGCKPTYTANKGYCKLSDSVINQLKATSKHKDAFVMMSYKSGVSEARCHAFVSKECTWSLANKAPGTDKYDNRCSNAHIRDTGPRCTRNQNSRNYRGFDGHNCKGGDYITGNKYAEFDNVNRPEYPFVIFEHSNGNHYCGGWDVTWAKVELWIH